MNNNIFIYISITIVLAATACHRADQIPSDEFSTMNIKNSVIRPPSRQAHMTLKQKFKHLNIAYPPKAVSLLAFKQEKRLEVWALHRKNWLLIQDYPILAASGKLGPKLIEGDYQVPEGIYNITYLNPNSSYHLSMKLNYPNSFDRKHAKYEGRKFPGTNIFIHGGSASVGCLAMGDDVIEQLYDLTKLTGIQNIRVIISPLDFRKTSLDTNTLNGPAWVADLYRLISINLRQYPASQKLTHKRI